MFDPRARDRARSIPSRAGEKSVSDAVDLIGQKFKNHDSKKKHRRRRTQDTVALKLEIPVAVVENSTSNDIVVEGKKKREPSPPHPKPSKTKDDTAGRDVENTVVNSASALSTLEFKLPEKKASDEREKFVQAALQSSEKTRGKRNIDTRMATVVGGEEDCFEGVEIIEPGVKVWRIMGREVCLQEDDQLGKFHTSDSYLIVTATALHRKGVSMRSNQVEAHVHFWIGKEAGIDKKALAAIRAVQLSDAMEPRPIKQHREVQGEESQRMIELFEKYGGEGLVDNCDDSDGDGGEEKMVAKNGPLLYLAGGCPSILAHVEERRHVTRLYRFKGKKNIRVNMVKLGAESLNDGDSFLLDAGEVIYVWFGKSSNWRERSLCAQAAMQMKGEVRTRKLPHTPTCTMEQGEEPADFWLALEGKGLSGSSNNSSNSSGSSHGQSDDVKIQPPKIASADSVENDAKAEKEVVYDLFEVDLTREGKVEPLYVEPDKNGSIFMSKLRSDCVYVLDAKTEIFIYVGSGAHPVQREVATQLAMQAVQGDPEEEDGEEPREDWVHIKSLVHPYLHPMFTLKFSDWFHHAGGRNHAPPFAPSKRRQLKAVNITVAQSIVNGEKILPQQILRSPKHSSSAQTATGVVFQHPFGQPPPPPAKQQRGGGKEKKEREDSRSPLSSPSTKAAFVARHTATKIAREHTKIIEKDQGSEVDLAVYEIKDSVLSVIPDHCYGSFHSDRCYAIICTFIFKKTKRYSMFFWQGRLSSKSSYFVWLYDLMPPFMDKMAQKGFRCKPNIGRIFQNREPEEFLELFDTGILVLAQPPTEAAVDEDGHVAPPPPPLPDSKGGGEEEKAKLGGEERRGEMGPKEVRRLSSIGYWKRMFHIRGASDMLTRTLEVPCEAASLNSTDAFVVQESPTRFFIWYGAMCSNMERKRAARTAVHIYTNLTEDDEEEEEQLAHLNTEEIFISCEEGQESAQFWNAIGGKGLYAKFTASATNAAGNERLENPILYQASLIRHYLMVQEVIDFTHEDLHEAGVYLLDMHFTIFVWRGAYASERLVEGAEKLAKAIAKQRCDDDAKFVSVTTGKEPLEFTHAFLGWHEVRKFVDPYAGRAAKLVDLGVVGRVVDVLPEDVRVLREQERKKEVYKQSLRKKNQLEAK